MWFDSEVVQFRWKWLIQLASKSKEMRAPQLIMLMQRSGH